jgi:hypothetical protein
MTNTTHSQIFDPSSFVHDHPTTVTKKTAVFQDVTPCSFIEFIDIPPKRQSFMYQNTRRQVPYYSNLSTLEQLLSRNIIKNLSPLDAIHVQ